MGFKKPRKRTPGTRKPQWRYIERYDVKQYQCGLRAGEYVRLRRDLPLYDWVGRATGNVYSAGLVWRVLPGAAEDPGVVFLLRPDGERHVWDDEQAIFEWFERVGTAGEPVDRLRDESVSARADYVDHLGRIYVTVGGMTASRFWNELKFFSSIRRHLATSCDFTVIRLSGFGSEHTEAICRFIDGLPRELQGKIIRM